MDTQRKCGITVSDIDAMTSEELLELAKAQGQYVGRRLPTEEKGGVYARVLDAPRFLRRLIQVHPSGDGHHHLKGFAALCGRPVRDSGGEALSPRWCGGTHPGLGKTVQLGPRPVQVVVIPSLIYQSDAQMAVGEIQEEDDGPHHAAKLFTYYLDNKSYWMNGLSSLTFSASYHNELVLLRVME